MGNPYTGDIYELAEGQQPEAGHVPLTKEQAEQLKQRPVSERITELQGMARGEAATGTAPAVERTDPATASALGMKVLTVEEIAGICHEANRALCEARGDYSQPAWRNAPDWQRASAIRGVEFHMANPTATPAASHENWLKEKMETGWRYGATKDAEAKTHPCCVPFEALPPDQQAKDHLFRGIVHSLRQFVV